MWPILIGVMAVAIVAILTFVATRPADFKIERSAVLAAPADSVFALLNDFHRWNDWSPWAKMDSTMKQTFEGAPSGVGAMQTWEGKKSGTGRSTIVESVAPARLLVKLEFIKPWTATNMAEFVLAPQQTGTKVTWAMTGRKNFLMKAFSLTCNMDKMIGKDFEKGLAAMKAIVESRAPEETRTVPAEV